MAQTPKGYQRLKGTDRAPVPGTKRVGPADPNETLTVTVRLRRNPAAPPLPDPTAIAKLPPNERRYLSREELARQYGATAADIARVEKFAGEYGLKVTEKSSAQRSVKLSGTVAQMNKAFGVDLGRYESPSKDVAYRGRESALNLPADLADAVEGVFGLDNRRQAKPLFRLAQTAPALNVTPLTPPQVASLYGFPGGSASGQCIGLLEFGGGYLASDISAFFTGLGKPAPSLSVVGVDGATNSPGVDPNADGEVALDIDVAGSVAPGATLCVYFAPWTEQGWLDILSTAIYDTTHRPSVLSISWGWPEFQSIQGLTWTQAAMDAVDAMLQEAVAMGVTVLAASGDNGASDGIGDGKVHTLFPSSDPFITSCGGTSIQNVSGANFDEVVWNGFGATGGGVSDYFPLPSWQIAAGVPPSINDGKVRRGIPDVAGNADPNSGYNLILDGAPFGPVGGTSAVAPIYAGLVALINASLGAPAGYLNPALYSLAGPFDFRDVTIGNNGSPGYSAKPGWDACTGLGSIHGAALQASVGGQYNWRWCNKCQGLAFAGNASPGPCPAGGNHDHTGSGDYILVQNAVPGPSAQNNWRWCRKCQGLAFAGNSSLGPCPAGGNHDHTGSGNYVIAFFGAAGQAGQSNWRWCNKCQGMAFAGNASPGPCPAGGNHDHTGSGNYCLIQNLAYGQAGQSNWRWCNKCQGLAFAGNASLGPCPAGGNHDHTGSGDYIVIQYIDPGLRNQANWRWCNKCQQLAFAGSATLGACPAGGNHDHTGSGYYMLIDNVPAGPHEQDNWRWCNKCQVLAFAGSATPGPCPAGGTHNHTGSGDYALAFARAGMAIAGTASAAQATT